MLAAAVAALAPVPAPAAPSPTADVESYGSDGCNPIGGYYSLQCYIPQSGFLVSYSVKEF